MLFLILSCIVTYCTICTRLVTKLKIGIVQCCYVYCAVLCVILYFCLHNGMKRPHFYGVFKEFFAYAIDDSKEGGYVLNITKTAALLVRNEVTHTWRLGRLRLT